MTSNSSKKLDPAVLAKPFEELQELLPQVSCWLQLCLSPIPKASPSRNPI
jgi:hypothetical protein